MKNVFTLGAAGAVVRGDRLLLVHHNYGDYKWVLPGGHVRFDELPIETAVREVHEETSIEVTVQGLISVRNRVDYRGNDTCFIFAMTPLDDRDPIPDGKEIDLAGYFTLQEMETMENLWRWPIWIARKIFQEERTLFLNRGDPQEMQRKYQAFL